MLDSAQQNLYAPGHCVRLQNAPQCSVLFPRRLQMKGFWSPFDVANHDGCCHFPSSQAKQKDRGPCMLEPPSLSCRDATRYTDCVITSWRGECSSMARFPAILFFFRPRQCRHFVGEEAPDVNLQMLGVLLASPSFLAACLTSLALPPDTSFPLPCAPPLLALSMYCACIRVLSMLGTRRSLR